jgi:hypothetical protein
MSRRVMQVGFSPSINIVNLRIHFKMICCWSQTVEVNIYIEILVVVF